MELKRVAGLSVSFALFSAVGFLAVACGEISVKQHPSASASQLLSMVTHTSIQATGGCSDPELSDIKFFLYTRKNPNTAISLNAEHPTQVNSRKKVIVLIHGWTASETGYSFPQLKDEYLKRYDCNVIMVDWSKLAWVFYTTSVCYLPKIGQIVANFLCHVNRQSKIDLSTVHLVGHSLGAHMSGYVGQKTLTTCRQRIGRITGMDPAGPLYQDLPISERLDKSDAIFVDVIHTNQGMLGYVGDCGDVDFYVNCGAQQPGCPVIDSDRVMDQPVSAVSCDHYRAIEYMAESINSDNFKARPCGNCPRACNPDGPQSSEISMGEDCPRNSSGAYVLTTDSQPPFALGSKDSLSNNKK